MTVWARCVELSLRPIDRRGLLLGPHAELYTMLRRIAVADGRWSDLVELRFGVAEPETRSANRSSGWLCTCDVTSPVRDL